MMFDFDEIAPITYVCPSYIFRGDHILPSLSLCPPPSLWISEKDFTTNSL